MNADVLLLSSLTSANELLLTSSVAPLVRLSYMKMVVMALPYTIVMGITGYFAVSYLL